MLAGGLANTSVVGLPMIEAFYGPAFLGVGILADQLGSYLALSTLGILVATLCSSGGAVGGRALLRRIAIFPPLQALVLGFVLMPFEYPPAFIALLERLSATLVPLALVSVGFQLRLEGIGALRHELASGLLFKQ
jgi:malate permease and related proteins